LYSAVFLRRLACPYIESKALTSSDHLFITSQSISASLLVNVRITGKQW